VVVERERFLNLLFLRDGETCAIHERKILILIAEKYPASFCKRNVVYSHERDSTRTNRPVQVLQERCGLLMTCIVAQSGKRLR